ncbi:hypothetical protein GCM10023187_14710 [Nibrella viscosa]|uniref:Uncharacterized protein n=1 Tax=Nibrella viscosa TaxID=1084524 RepID=A0ABP8K613_9BACT
MEKTYKNIGYLFIAIWLMVLIGFHQTYTVFFPQFKNFRWEHHLHGATLMTWLLMLMVQPFLIKYGKYTWHRTLGKLGYVLAPLAFLSMFSLVRMAYLRDTAHRPEPDVLAGLAISIPPMLAFGLFASLAFLYQKQTFYHVRYITATSFPLIGPGLGRALITYGGVPFPVAVSLVFSLATLIALVFLLLDLRNRKNPYPLLLIFGMLLLNLLCWQFQTSGWWLATAKTFAWAFF